MRKFTLLLALLLSFVGVANAQLTEGSVYDDPATAPGVTPALSTADGTQFAYYLRNVKYGETFTARASNNNGVIVPIKDASRACKVSLSKTGDTFIIHVLNDDATEIATNFQPGAGAAMLWTSTGTDVSCQWSIYSVNSDDIIAFNIKGVQSANKVLEARSENDDNGLGGHWSIFTMNGINATNTAQQWQFIPANDAAKKAAALTINVAAGDDIHGNLATFSASYPVAKPAGYTAYSATYADGALNMTEIEGDVIPGNTGVILKGDVNNALSMQPSLTVPTSVTSALTPTNEAEKTVADGDNVYGLGANAAGTLALYKLSAGTIGANKAYYAAAAGTPAIALNFGGDVTGISNAQVNNNVNAPMFDLSGRRVVKAVKGGLYIQNGKKFIVK